MAAEIRVSMTSLILENTDISENKYFFLPGLRTNLITQDASSEPSLPSPSPSSTGPLISLSAAKFKNVFK